MSYRQKLCLAVALFRRANAVWTVPIDDRHAPVPAKRPFRDLDAGGRLAPLVLASIDELDDPGHRLGFVSRGDKLLRAEVVLYVADQDGVELVIGREAVRVLLTWFQLGGRRLGDHALG